MYNSGYESCFSHLSLHPEDSVLYVGLVYYAIPFFCRSFPLDGKDKAVDVGAIPELVLLLKDDNTDVRAQAAGAIMT